MNDRVLPLAALAVGLLPAFVGAQAHVDIGAIAQSSGESFVCGVVPSEKSIAEPKASPAVNVPPSKESWGLTVDRTVQMLAAAAAPCERRPSRAIVCFLDESVKLSDVRVPGMRGPVFLPTHQYTTNNGRSEFSCYHKTREVNCRSVKDKVESGLIRGIPQFIITDRVACDTITEQSHSCECTYGCE